MTDVIESSHRTGVRPVPAPGWAESGSWPAHTPEQGLRTLATTLDRLCEDLFATVPFPGDQSTGHEINRYVDEVVGSLRELRAEADDLHRAMTVARQRAERRA